MKIFHSQVGAVLLIDCTNVEDDASIDLPKRLVKSAELRLGADSDDEEDEDTDDDAEIVDDEVDGDVVDEEPGDDEDGSVDAEEDDLEEEEEVDGEDADSGDGSKVCSPCLYSLTCANMI